MDISGIQNGPATGAAGTPSRPPVRKSSNSNTAAGTQAEAFRPSGAASQVQDLVDRLVSGPDARVDVVDKFRALLAVGALDTPEAAAKAARALLESDG